MTEQFSKKMASKYAMEFFGTLILLFLCCLRNGQCSVNDTKTLLKDLLSDYDINVRPVDNQHQPVNVLINVYFKSIQEFDEVQGKFSFVGGLYVKWYDVSLKWDPALYGGITETTVLYSNVWIPELLLMSPAENVNAQGQKWNKIRLYADGSVAWLPVNLIESTCSVNVRKYPFDTQECETAFTSIGYHQNEVMLYPMSTEVNFDLYQDNSLWEISGSKVIQSQIGGSSQISVILYLDRKPSFVIINVVLPTLFLSLLNVVVFLLIPESGERVSYSITVLLAIAVFMTIISDMLPRSSEPVPFISYKLMTDMVLSSLIVVVTIANLTWYHREDAMPVPRWLQTVYRVLTCSCVRSSKPTSTPVCEIKMKSVEKCDNTSVVTDNEVLEGNAEKIEKKLHRLFEEAGEVQEKEKVNVTWRMMSILVDRISLVLFTAATICNAAVFVWVTAFV